MEKWVRKINEGMKLIIDGCKGNNDWTACHRECPFDEFCTSIYKDEETEFTTPNNWETIRHRQYLRKWGLEYAEN